MYNSLWSIIFHTDFATKIILIVLFCMSVLCWSLYFYKLLILKQKAKELKEAQQLLMHVTTFDELLSRASSFQNNFAGFLISKYLAEFKILLKMHEKNGTPLTEKDWQMLEMHMNTILEESMNNEESGLSFLAANAAVSPLIGLFGTVWGLIHAFMGIGMQKSADISAVAPGIAEALITTLAGLIIAIPALILFHHIKSKVKSFEHSLILLSERTLAIMKISATESFFSVNENSNFIKSAIVK